MRCSQTRLTALRRTGVNLAKDLSTYDRKSRDFRARVAILAQNNVRDGAQMTGDPLNFWLTQESSQDFDTDLPKVAILARISSRVLLQVSPLRDSSQFRELNLTIVSQGYYHRTWRNASLSRLIDIFNFMKSSLRFLTISVCRKYIFIVVFYLLIHQSRLAIDCRS